MSIDKLWRNFWGSPPSDTRPYLNPKMCRCKGRGATRHAYKIKRVYSPRGKMLLKYGLPCSCGYERRAEIKSRGLIYNTGDDCPWCGNTGMEIYKDGPQYTCETRYIARAVQFGKFTPATFNLCHYCSGRSVASGLKAENA